MAEFNAKAKKTKNQFSARMVSRLTKATVCWTPITDDFAHKVFGAADATDVTAEQAEAVLPGLLNNDMVMCVISDHSKEREVIAVDQF